MDCTVHKVTKSGTRLSDLHLTLQASKHLLHGSFSLFHLAFFLSFHSCNLTILFIFFFLLKYHFLTLLVSPSSDGSHKLAEAH